MQKLTSLLAAAAIASIPTAALADNHDEGPTIRENARYLNIVLVDIKAGKRGRAEEIIDTYFAKASDAAGTPKPVLVHLQTGEWDFLTAWTMHDGPVSLTYTATPNGKKWWAAMVELAGGEEQANAIRDEYSSLVARSTSMIGHRHLDGEE